MQDGKYEIFILTCLYVSQRLQSRKRNSTLSIVCSVSSSYINYLFIYFVLEWN